MPQCPHCHEENPQSAERCAQCGAPLTPSQQDAGSLLASRGSGEAWDQGDPLDGLEGLLPPAAVPSMPAEGTETPETPSETEQERAALFQRIATEPPPLEPPRTPPAAPPEPPVSRPVRLVLCGLVLLSVVLPLWTHGHLDAALRQPASSEKLGAFLREIAPGQRVLVAFDYAPSAAAELRPVQDAILATLDARSALLLALSTRPEGVGAARVALESLEDLSEGGDNPQFVHLGYLPGDASGLRLALSDLPAALGHVDANGVPLESIAAFEGLRGLYDLDALIVLTDDAPLARRWVEQAATWTGLPLAMITTAAIEPLLAPYVTTGQVDALVAGAYAGLASAGERPQRTLYSADGFAGLSLVLALALTWGLVRRPIQGSKPQ